MELQEKRMDEQSEHPERIKVEEISIWGSGIVVSAFIDGEKVGNAYIHFLHSDALHLPLAILPANIEVHWDHKEEAETILIEEVLRIVKREPCASLICINPNPRDENGQRNARRLRRKLRKFGFIRNGPELVFDR